MYLAYHSEYYYFLLAKLGIIFKEEPEREISYRASIDILQEEHWTELTG